VTALMRSTTAALLDIAVTVGKMLFSSRDRQGANTIALLCQALPVDVAPCSMRFFVTALMRSTTAALLDIAVMARGISRDRRGANTIVLLYPV